jgi:hypothetical protein
MAFRRQREYKVIFIYLDCIETIQGNSALPSPQLTDLLYLNSPPPPFPSFPLPPYYLFLPQLGMYSHLHIWPKSGKYTCFISLTFLCRQSVMHCGFRCTIICTMVYSQVCLNSQQSESHCRLPKFRAQSSGCQSHSEVSRPPKGWRGYKFKGS